MTPTYKPVRSQSSGVQSSVISALHCGVPYFFVTSFQLVCHSRIRRSGGLSSIQVTSINTVLIDIVFPFWFWLTNQAFDCFIRLSHFRIRRSTIRRSALLSLIPVIWINRVITEIISALHCGVPYVFVTSAQFGCHSRIRRSAGFSPIHVTSINTVIIDIVFSNLVLTHESGVRLSHFRIRRLTIRRSA